MKTLLLILFKSKFLISALSIVASVGTYTMLYGWKYAVGFVGLIFIHEMGHYFAAKQKNLNVGFPMFIPFVGAWIELKEQPLNAEVEAYVAYGGPFIGSLAAFALYYLGRDYNDGLLLALAHAGFLINFFNLIPISPLDGGRITSIISPRIWLIGAPILLAIWCYHPSPMLILISILAFPQLKMAWKYDANAPENKAYYGVPDTVKFEYGVLYFALVLVLGLMLGHGS